MLTMGFLLEVFLFMGRKIQLGTEAGPSRQRAWILGGEVINIGSVLIKIAGFLDACVWFLNCNLFLFFNLGVYIGVSLGR